MTRIESVRHAADVTKDSVRHAAEVAAPYANTAKENAVLYGRQAGVFGRQAGAAARQQYDAKLADKVGQAREQVWAAVPPKAAGAVENAARRTRETAKVTADYTAPRVGTAVAVTRAVAVPATEEVMLRGGAALHALRGQVSATDIDRLIRARMRRAKAGRAARGALVVALTCGAAFAAWQWWSKQSNPEWLVEPSEPTEVGDRASMNGSSTLTVVEPLDGGASLNGSSAKVDRVDGSPPAEGLDPEVEAKQSEADRRTDGEGDH